MEVNVNELTGMALDWAVGMAIGKPLSSAPQSGNRTARVWCGSRWATTVEWCGLHHPVIGRTADR